jgi:antitoxin VapB
MQIARLFPNGQSQAVRLPKEFRFEGDKVYIQRVGNTVILQPFNAPWQALFDSLTEFTADFAAGTREHLTSSPSDPIDERPES